VKLVELLRFPGYFSQEKKEERGLGIKTRQEKEEEDKERKKERKHTPWFGCLVLSLGDQLDCGTRLLSGVT